MLMKFDATLFSYELCELKNKKHSRGVLAWCISFSQQFELHTKRIHTIYRMKVRQFK